MSRVPGGVIASDQTAAIDFGDDHHAFRDSVRAFLDRDVIPGHPRSSGDGRIPADVFARAGDYGFLGICASEAHGGAGQDDPRFGVVLVEECVAAGLIGLAYALAMHTNVCIPFVAALDGEVPESWAARLVAGTMVAAFADASALANDVNGRVAGRIVGLPGSSSADLLVAVGRDDTVALVDRTGEAPDAAEVVRLIGLSEVPCAAVHFGADAAVLIDAGAAGLRASIDLWTAVVNIAAADRALRLGIEYARERKVFGKALSGFENTRQVVGAAAAQLETSRDFTYRVLTGSSGEPLAARAATARLTAEHAHRLAADGALQLHGGYGYMREYPISQAFADAGTITALPRLGEPLEDVVARARGL